MCTVVFKGRKLKRIFHKKIKEQRKISGILLLPCNLGFARDDCLLAVLSSFFSSMLTCLLTDSETIARPQTKC